MSNYRFLIAGAPADARDAPPPLVDFTPLIDQGFLWLIAALSERLQTFTLLCVC